MLSVAARPDTGTVSDVEAAGSVKAPTVGAVRSAALLTKTVTDEDCELLEALS